MSSRPCHAVATALGLALAGCAGAAAPAGAKSADYATEPATIEEAQAELERARAELQLGTARSETSLAPAAPAASAPPSPAQPSTAQGAATADSTSSRPECATRCRAIGSMRRAVAAICRMAGDDDARCTDAKKVLQDSEGSVASCGC